jgi:hypothetical protein
VPGLLLHWLQLRLLLHWLQHSLQLHRYLLKPQPKRHLPQQSLPLMCRKRLNCQTMYLHPRNLRSRHTRHIRRNLHSPHR